MSVLSFSITFCNASFAQIANVDLCAVVTIKQKNSHGGKEDDSKVFRNLLLPTIKNIPGQGFRHQNRVA
jgi:hypothetical protein